MGWNDLDVQQPRENSEDEQARRKEQHKTLRTCVRAALAPDSQKPLEEFLRRIAVSGSYSRGEPEQTAYKEGYRALAAQLLAMGDKL